MINNNIVTIGMMGLTFKSGNKGCAALAYSFLELLKTAAKKNNKKLKLIIIAKSQMKDLNICDDIVVECNVIEYHFSKLKTQIEVRKNLKKCDYVFDFTEGDSFSDIYGFKQLLVNGNLKLACIRNKIPLILGPQTYGPYERRISKIIAKKIIKKSYEVFTRDELSTKYVKELAGREVETLIDVAFALPYDNKKVKNTKIKIGINISGLLWNGGYTGNNEFNLTVSYKEYCKKIISYLIQSKKYEIHLIPHVICEDYNNRENDLKVSHEIKEEFKECIVSDVFDTPMEAKTYISNMDIFIGARMHSDIAAYSSNVAVIPFSYSRKFEGLFETLKYPYCISGKKLSTKEAVNKTIEYINDYNKLQKAIKTGSIIAKEKVNKFQMYLNDLLK